MDDVTLMLRPRPIGLFGLSLLVVRVGIVTGLGAVAFCALIAVLHNLMFRGHFSFAYDANEFTARPAWGWLVIFVPVIGGMVVTFLVTNFAPEAKGARGDGRNLGSSAEHSAALVRCARHYIEGACRRFGRAQRRAPRGLGLSSKI